MSVRVTEVSGARVAVRDGVVQLRAVPPPQELIQLELLEGVALHVVVVVQQQSAMHFDLRRMGRLEMTSAGRNGLPSDVD